MSEKMSTNELLESIWFALYDMNILKSMEMLKDDMRMYSKEQREYLEGIADTPFEEDETD
jgi:hypothetical protein